MANPPTLSTLIRGTLLAVAAELSLAGCSQADDCPDLVDPVDVDAWNLGTDEVAGLLAALYSAGPYEDDGPGWAELSDQAKCEAACLYAAHEDVYLASGSLSNGPDRISAEIHECSLVLYEAEGVVTHGTVSCAGAVVTTRWCGYYLGRRPLAWTPIPRVITNRQAHLDAIVMTEHVSVTAFVELAAQLRELVAPQALIERCLAAAEDERRHVAVLVSLGARVPDEAAEPAIGRSRLAIALHNATEGCVAETWAALLGHWQAQHAGDELTRAAFAELAGDETGHAQLAWDLHTWLCEGLWAQERAEVEAARSLALGRLEQTAINQALAVPERIRDALGLPDLRQARVLALEFGRRLSAAAA